MIDIDDEISSVCMLVILYIHKDNVLLGMCTAKAPVDYYATYIGGTAV